MRFLIFFILIGFLVSFPSLVYAQGGLVPCSGPDCDFCDIFTLVENIFKFVLYGNADPLIPGLVPIIATGLFAWGAIYLFFGGVSEANRKKGKDILTNTIVGVVIIYSAWIIVGALLGAVVDGTSLGTFGFSATGVEIQCGLSDSAAPRGLRPIGTGVTGGQCRPLTTGPATAAALANTCFGDNAEIASGIVATEHRGNSNPNPAAPSTSDKCTVDKRPVSWGLFQINISAHKVGNLDCPSAFDKTYGPGNRDCRVINLQLYNACVNAITNPANNIVAACTISQNGTNWCAWGAATRNICSIVCPR